MSHPKKLLTVEQVRARFSARGETFAAWARRHGFPVRSVSAVLNGVNKGHFGVAHEIAVALGIKAGVDESSADHGDRNTQSRQAA